MKTLGMWTAAAVAVLHIGGWGAWVLMAGNGQTGSRVFLYLVYPFIAALSCAAVLWIGRKYDKARAQALRDVLTGIYNRRYAMESLPRLLNKANRLRKPLAVTMVDVNEFKAVNDSFGHHVGDALLQQIARAMAGEVKRGEFVARWGGDEFILIGSSRRGDGALRSRIEEKLKPLGATLQLELSVSVGSAVYPEDGRTFEALLRRADELMFADKCRSKQKTDERQTRIG